MRKVPKFSGEGEKILGIFHLKWLIFVQIALYILTEMLGYLLLES